MAISTMEKLVLIVPKSDIDKMLKTLVFSRCVEIRPLDVVIGNDNEGEEASQDGFLKKPEYQTEKFECDRLLARIKDSLEFIAPYRTDKKGLFAAKPSVCEEKYSEDNESYKTGIEAVTKICALSDKLSSLDTEYKKCEELLTMLSPWDTFDLKLSESTTKNTLTVLGVIPKLFSLDSLLGELDEKGYRALIEKVSESESATYISVTSHNEDFDAVSELLVKYGFLKSDFKNLTLTPYEESVKLKEKLEILQSEKENIKKEITEAAKFTCEIEFVYDVVKLKSIKTLAKEKLVCTEETVILSGYVPVKAKKRLEKRLEKLDCYFEFFEVSDEDDVPVELSNNAFATPVEFVEGLYSYPRYGSFDPSFLVAIFYYVIFGLMLADVGYGLLLVIAGLLGKKLLHPKPSMRKLLNLFAISGVSCIIWGILFGSYFGDMPVAVMTNMFGIENPPNVALWFDPVKSPINFLIVSIAMGVIHLFTGMGIKMWQLIKSGHPVAAIFDIGSWCLIFIAFLLLTRR